MDLKRPRGRPKLATNLCKEGIDIITAMEDPFLLGSIIKNQDSFKAWKIFYKAFFSLDVNINISEFRSDLDFFTDCTDRKEWPKKEIKEAWICAGRKSRKTLNLAIMAVYYACFVDHSNILGPGETGHIILIAPTKQQASILKNYVSGFLATPSLKDLVEKEIREEIRLKNNVSITILSSNYTSIRGYTAIMVLLDEVAFLNSEGSKPDYEILQAVRPTLTTTQGPLICASTPYARSGIFYKAFEAYWGQEDSDVLIWKSDTASMNPCIDSEVIERAYEESHEIATTEYGAEFRNDISNFLDSSNIMACVGAHSENPPRAGIQYKAFIDSSGGAKKGDNYCLAIGHNEKGRVIVDLLRTRKPPFDPNSVATEYSEIMKMYRISKASGDYYAAEYTVNSYKDNGIEYEKIGTPSSDLYLYLEGVINTQSVELPNEKGLIKELSQLERRTSRTGSKDKISHPDRLHDDRACAVAGLAYLLGLRRSISKKFGVYEKGEFMGYRYIHPENEYSHFWLQYCKHGNYFYISSLDSPIEETMEFKKASDFEKWLKDRFYCEIKNCTGCIPNNFLIY